MTDSEILATGPELVRQGVRGIEPVIEELISGAYREIQMLAYLLTPSAVQILELLSAAAERRVKVTIVVNSFRNQNPVMQKKLTKLSSHSPSVQVLDLDEKRKQLHAKVVVSDRLKAFVGSANFS